MCLDARCETQEYRSYLLENSPFFLSSSNPKKVNGAMNTNINNKKLKLVPLRNQPMQAFACKRECVKEALGNDDRKEERGGKQGERKADDRGLERGDLRGLRMGGRKKKLMTTPRLIRFRFNDTQKPMDVISDRRDC